MSEETFKSAYELQQEKAEELFKKIVGEKDVVEGEVYKKIKTLCEKHAELLNDFKFLRELNRVATERFDEVVDRFPNTQEIDCLLENLGDCYSEETDKEHYYLRQKTIKSFRKIVEALEKLDVKVRPKSYAESVDTEEVQ